MNLNSDLGEGSAAEEDILAVIDSANVACGVHAGSVGIAIATARRCLELGIEVGAHPGYDDREGFGRLEMGLPAEEIRDLVQFQVAGLAAIVPVAYIKPHGALYHRCQSDPAAAAAVAGVALRLGLGVMGQPGMGLLAAAVAVGVPAYREGFADRLVLPDGTLAPRERRGALLEPEAAALQAVRLATSGTVDSICVHGDGRRAGEVARAVHAALREAGITTGRLRTGPTSRPRTQ